MNDKFIFISYSHKDSDKVHPVINAMRSEVSGIWYDEGIEAGTEWPEYIAEKIRDCTVFIAFVSPSSVASTNCRNEINYAISLRKEMLIVYLEPTELSGGMQLQIGSIQAMFYYRSRNVEEFVKNLLAAQILKPVISLKPSEPVVEQIQEPEPMPREESPVATAILERTEMNTYVAPSQKTSNNEKTVRMLPIFLNAVLIAVVSVTGINHATTHLSNWFLIVLIGIFTPVVMLFLTVAGHLMKKKRYTKSQKKEISTLYDGFYLFALIGVTVADCFYMNCDWNVFLKILFSVAINFVACFLGVLALSFRSLKD